jgi:hypothetical protein
MPLDLSNFKGGPCVAVTRGREFYAKDGVNFDLSPDLFTTGSDAFQDQNQRVNQRKMNVSFTPTGAWADYVRLLPYANHRVDEFLARRIVGVTFNASTEVWTYTAHGFSSGDGVRVAVNGTGAAFPTGLNGTTTYYIGKDSADAGKLYTTRADAVANDGATNLVSVTTTGTGTITFISTEPLVIYALDGSNKKLTIHNAELPTMPSVTLIPNATIFGTVNFEARPLNGTSWSDASSLYTLATEAYSPSTYADSDVVTVPYSIAWGSAVPWSIMEPKDAISIGWNMATAPVDTAAYGIVGHRLLSIRPKVTLTPKNIDLADVEAKLRFQDTGAARGQRITNEATLTIQGPSASPYFQLYLARLVQAPLIYKTGEDRAGSFVWECQRAFTDGVPGPWFYAGTQAPS